VDIRGHASGNDATNDALVQSDNRQRFKTMTTAGLETLAERIFVAAVPRRSTQLTDSFQGNDSD
jgi:hypothetical protein